MERATLSDSVGFLRGAPVSSYIHYKSPKIVYRANNDLCSGVDSMDVFRCVIARIFKGGRSLFSQKSRIFTVNFKFFSSVQWIFTVNFKGFPKRGTRGSFAYPDPPGDTHGVQVCLVSIESVTFTLASLRQFFSVESNLLTKTIILRWKMLLLSILEANSGLLSTMHESGVYSSSK
jgi:hypothetical protein